jgi:hypothetical protein
LLQALLQFANSNGFRLSNSSEKYVTLRTCLKELMGIIVYLMNRLKDSGKIPGLLA